MNIDDEREALETAIWEALEPRLEDVIDLDLNVPSENVIFAILVGQVVEAVAALRRTEVPEPSADDRIVRAIDALSWRPEHDGADPARVQDDYMRRAQAADTALAILTENREGAF